MILEQFILEGVFPERALLRIRREGIPLFHVKKVQKNQILFSIKRKHTEKVFAIYQNVWYNIAEGCPYTLKRVGANFPRRIQQTLTQRVGLAIGAICFVLLCLFSQNYIFRIEILGTNVYKREIYQALEDGGLTLYSRYDSANNARICANILRLDGVSFCTLKKQGVTLIVEVQSNPFTKPQQIQGDMRSCYQGEILSLCVLKGTPLVKAGEKVQVNQALVGGYFQTQEGKRVDTEVLAWAKIGCEYQAEIQAQTVEEAFAVAYLSLGDSQNVSITNSDVVAVENVDGAFYVRIQYTVTQSINL